jgi:hypothetical protein
MTKTKFIVPDDFNIPKQVSAISTGMQEVIWTLEPKLKVGYHNWKDENKPVWEMEIVQTGGSKIVRYSTTSVPYVWVSEGTKGPYPITPKKPGGFLFFKSGGAPKTTPKSIYSGPGKPGNKWNKRKGVMHPGIEPRFFPENVLKEARGEELLQKMVQIKIDRSGI